MVIPPFRVQSVILIITRGVYSEHTATHMVTGTLVLTIQGIAKSAAQLGSREPVQAALQQEPGPVLWRGREL